MKEKGKTWKRRKKEEEKEVGKTMKEEEEGTKAEKNGGIDERKRITE